MAWWTGLQDHLTFVICMSRTLEHNSRPQLPALHLEEPADVDMRWHRMVKRLASEVCDTMPVNMLRSCMGVCRAPTEWVSAEVKQASWVIHSGETLRS